MTKLSREEYVEALERMKRSHRDRLGVLAELGVTGLGAAAGLAISGPVAAALGVATLAGSTTLASIFGGVLVVTTPIGWAVGSAVVSGAFAYGAVSLVRAASRRDTLKELTIRELEERLAELQQEAQQVPQLEGKTTRFLTSLQLLVANGRISQERATGLVAVVERQHRSPEEVLVLLRALLDEVRVETPS